MKSLSVNLLKTLSILVLFIGGLTSCLDDDDLIANITVNEGPSGDIGGDFTGNGGNASRTINWTNRLTTADYNADITATTKGTFNMVVADADGKIVLNRTLKGGTEPDTIDGVTQAGKPGKWTVTITITSFNGDGSYSLSEGD